MIAKTQPWGVIDSLRIIPANPVIFDSVSIICQSYFPYTYCYQVSSSVGINGNIIEINAYHMQGPSPAVCYRTDTIFIGNNLDVGYYCVIYNLWDTLNNLLDLDTTCFSILPNNVSVYIENSFIKFFPNPVEDYATLSFSGFVNNSIYELELLDLRGNRLRTELISNNNYVFYRNQLPSGVYFFLIRKDEGILVRNKICLK